MNRRSEKCMGKPAHPTPGARPMRPSQNDLPRSPAPAAHASGAVLRLLRARAIVRTRNTPASAPPARGRGTRAGGLIAMLTVLALAVIGPTPAHAERGAAVEVAMVTDLAGRVERQPQTAEQWSNVGLDEPVALFDAMRTWASSTAELRFVDGTVVMLESKTRLRISPMLFDPSQAPREVQLALASGAAEIRAGNRRLWIDLGDGEQRAVEPGSTLRVSAVAGGRLDIGAPTRPTPRDFERGAAPGAGDSTPDGEPAPDGPRAPDAPNRPRPFDPTAGGVDPTGVVEQVVDAVPGGAGVDVRLPGVEVDVPADGDGILRLPDLIAGQMPDQMPDQMPPQLPQPQLDGLPVLPGGPEGLLPEILPDGIITGLDDLPPVPTTGRVRVEVEIRRR